MDHSRKRLSHVRRRAEFLQVIKPASDLVAHGVRDVIARDLAFIVDQSFAPDLGVNFILRVKMVANIVFQFGNMVQLLLPMDSHPRGCLP